MSDPTPPRKRGRPRQTRCLNGHPITVYPNGVRGCLVCRAAQVRRHRARKKLLREAENHVS